MCLLRYVIHCLAIWNHMESIEIKRNLVEFSGALQIWYDDDYFQARMKKRSVSNDLTEENNNRPEIQPACYCLMGLSSCCRNFDDDNQVTAQSFGSSIKSRSGNFLRKCLVDEGSSQNDVYPIVSKRLI